MDTAISPASTEAMCGQRSPLNSDLIPDAVETAAVSTENSVAPEAAEMTFSPSLVHLLGALLKAREEFQPIIKNRTNPHFNSRYADLDAVFEATQKPLGAHGLHFFPFPVTNLEKNQAGISYLLLHESGEFISGRVMFSAKVDAPGSGSAFTYARRYVYQMLIGVTAEDDDDGAGANDDGAVAANKNKKTEPPKRAPQPAGKTTEPARLTEGESAPPSTPATALSAAAQSQLYYDRVAVLKQKLLATGFKAEGNKTAASVLLHYILKTANVGKLEDMGNASWDKILGELEALPDNDLLNLLSAALKEMAQKTTV